MQGKYEESEEALRELPPHETLVAFYNVFGGAHARHGQWHQALTNWERVVQLAPQDHMGYMYLAPLRLQLDDVVGYENLRGQILRQFGYTPDSRIAERMVTASLLLPAAPSQMPVLAKMAEVAVNTATNDSDYGFNLFAGGLAKYRQGHYAAAADLLQRVLPLDIGPQGRTEARLVLAMAQLQLGRTEQARATLAEAVDTANRSLPKAGRLDEQWNAWLGIQILMREAQTLVGTNQTQH